MNISQHPRYWLPVFLLYGFIQFSPAQAAEVDQLTQALDQAISTNNIATIKKAHQEVLKAVNNNQDNLKLQFATASGYIAQADLLRIDRHTGNIDSDTDKSYRKRQAVLGKSGSEHAVAALKLASTDAQKSEAHRLFAESTIHRISGPLTGLTYGPIAKQHVDEALKLDPQNVQAIRSSGLMFLHNPPINGGDLDKAVKTFQQCVKLNNNDVHHALIAHAWYKQERYDRAQHEIARALLLNKNNRLANNLKKLIEEQNEN